MPIHSFNVRVYGILISGNHVLITHEKVKKKYVTKFPGGGLEFGEGTIDCLKREFIEELGIEVYEITHFYTTDFFVESAFKPTDQIISIYYLVAFPIKYGTLPILTSLENSQQTFEWKKIETINPEHFFFPIDKVVVEKLLSLK